MRNPFYFLAAAFVWIICAHGCSGAEHEPAPSALPARAIDCSVIDANPGLASAICEADGKRAVRAVADAIDGKAFQTIDEAMDALQIQEKVLARVFQGERAVGQGLDWERLEADEFRIDIAGYLAQAIRAGRVAMPLVELQRFAKSLSRRGIPAGDSRSISLLGLTDSRQEIPSLESIAIHGTDNSQRVAAMEALAYMCGDDARSAESRLLNASATRDLMATLSPLRKKLVEMRQQWCAADG